MIHQFLVKQWISRPYALALRTWQEYKKLLLLDLRILVLCDDLVQKEFVGGSKWYEKLGIGYNGNIKSQVSFYDSAFSFGELIDTMQWGANHDIPILLSLPALGPFESHLIFHTGTGGMDKFYRTWNDNLKKVDTSIQKGFHTAHEMSLGLSVNTAIFGQFESRKKDAQIQAIRHTIRPSFGISYKPDLMQEYYYREQIDTLGNELLFSVFDGSIFGPYSPGRNAVSVWHRQ
jgi:hypothetical protein